MARPSMRDRLKEEAAKAANEGASYLKLPGKVTFFQPEDDEYELDVIPYENDKNDHPKDYEKGELIPFVRYKLHTGIGAEDKKYICPTTIGKPCPICEERARLAKKRDSDEDLLKALQPKERFLMNVIDLKDRKNDGVQLWDYSHHLFLKRLLGDIDKTENSASSRRRSTPHAGFAELEGGQTLFVSFIEKKMGKNKFYEADRIDAEDRDDYKESILDEAYNLDDMLKILTYDELDAIFLELDPSEQGSNRKRDDKDDDKDDKRSSRRGRDDGDDRRSRRGRDDDKDDDKEDRRSSRRGRDTEDDKDKDDRRSRRGRDNDGDDKDKKDDPPPSRSRRGRGDDKDEDKKDDDKETSSSRSRRSRGSDDEKKDDKDEDKESGRSSRRRGRDADDDDKKDKDDDKDTGSGRSSRRRGQDDEDDKKEDKGGRPERPRRGSDDEPECIAKGKFGEECGKHDKCYDCPDDIWNKCKKLTDG